MPRLSGLHAQLATQRPAAVRVTEIPRAGLVNDIRIERALTADLPLADALPRGAIATTDTVTPEELHRIGESIGYEVAVTWGARTRQPRRRLHHPCRPGNPVRSIADRPLPAADRRPPTHHLRQRPPHQHQDQRGAPGVERAFA